MVQKAFLGIADFSMLHAFTVWNLSVDQIKTSRSRGMVTGGRKKLLKWEFYAVAAEEMMNYVNEDEVETGPTRFEPTPELQHKAQIIRMVVSMQDEKLI